MTHFSFSEHHDRIHESLTAMAQIYGEDASILHIDYSMWSLTFAHTDTQKLHFHTGFINIPFTNTLIIGDMT